MIENKIKELGLALPPAPAALATYVPAIQTGSFIFTSGQLPLADGKVQHPGKLGQEVLIENAKLACQTALLNALAAIKTRVSLDHITPVKMGVFVASAPEFTEQHLVANGASDLLKNIFTEKGNHARFAVGVASLPLNACVEIELTVYVNQH